MPLLTERQAAEEARVDPRTIRRLIREGRLRALDFGGGTRHRCRIDPADLKAVRPPDANPDANDELGDEPLVTTGLRRGRRRSASSPARTVTSYLPTV